MPSPIKYAGEIVTADDWNTLSPKLVVQNNDQTVTSSTTPIASEITFTPEINAVYEYWLWISYSATINSGFFWEWDAPNALIASFSQAVDHAAASGSADTGQLVNFRRAAHTTNRQAGGSDATSPPGQFHSAYDSGTFTTDGTPNTITMKFAQAAS
ncbi:hypothetical protein O3S80_52815, partial [Streptomyces sp. Lzd4kr]|nr:hypothetical protein [Streptomyces sp. Lzd4kr]